MHRRKAEERVMEVEKQMAIFRVEQSESTRKCEDLQEAKARVSNVSPPLNTVPLPFPILRVCI